MERVISFIRAFYRIDALRQFEDPRIGVRTSSPLCLPPTLVLWGTSVESRKSVHARGLLIRGAVAVPTAEFCRCPGCRVLPLALALGTAAGADAESCS
jgi:hypothetical protein